MFSQTSGSQHRVAVTSFVFTTVRFSMSLITVLGIVKSADNIHFALFLEKTTRTVPVPSEEIASSVAGHEVQEAEQLWGLPFPHSWQESNVLCTLQTSG